MKVRNRVHVVAQGWEVARVVEPIYRLKADRVVFIRRREESALTEFEQAMLNDIEASDRIDLEIRTANLYDLGSALQAFTQAVQDHAEEDVYINVSTGTQIAAIAGMMAAQAGEATPFYVEPTTADHCADAVDIPSEPLVPSSGAISELPVFKLVGPTPEQLQILAYLAGHEGATKKDLIRYAEAEHLPFIAHTESKSDEGRYRMLESHIIDPLTKDGYVRVEKAGRKKHVFIEQRGIDALAAFPLASAVLETVQAEAEDSGTVDEVRPSRVTQWMTASQRPPEDKVPDSGLE